MIFHLTVFLPLVAFLLNFFVWTYIISLGKYNKLNRAIVFYVSIVMVYSMLVFYLRIGQSLETNFYLLKLIPMSYLPLGVLFLNFTYHLLRKNPDKILYGFSFIVWGSILINLFTNIFVTGYIKSNWGYHLDASHPLSFYLTFICIVLSLIHI